MFACRHLRSRLQTYFVSLRRMSRMKKNGFAANIEVWNSTQHKHIRITRQYSYLSNRNVEEDIKKVELKIEASEKKIENVEEKIEDAGKKIEIVDKRFEIVTYFLCSGETVEQKQSWLRERFPRESTNFEIYTKYNEDALKEEKLRLQAEKEGLQAEKERLQAKEKALRQEKAQWMEEKQALRQKEARLQGESLSLSDLYIIDNTASPLSALKEEKFIRDITNFRMDLPSGYDVLGVVHDLPFVERDEVMCQVHNALNNLKSPKEHERAPMVTFCGTPGSGKSRALVECTRTLDSAKHMVLHCTFNNRTCVEGVERDYSDNPCVSIALRLLFIYARYDSHVAWSSWLGRLWESRVPISNIRLEDVITYLKQLYDYSSDTIVVLTVDEVFNMSLMQYWEVRHCDNMISTLCGMQDKHFFVIFACFGSKYLKYTKTDSSRPLKALFLPELSLEVSSKILKEISPDEVEIMAMMLGLSGEKASRLLLTVVGTIPRVLEFTVAKLQSLKFISAAQVAHETGRLTAERYPTILPFRLLRDALWGQHGANSTSEQIYRINNKMMSLDDCINMGLCMEYDYDVTAISSARLLACAYTDATNKIYPRGFVAALQLLVQIPLMKPDNIWEELVRRLLILRSYSQEQYTETTTTTIYNLFQPMRIISEDDSLFHNAVYFPTLSNCFMRYVVVPTPTDACNHSPAIWIADNKMESGIDSILFLRKENSDMICIGIQNKWSEDDEQQICGTNMYRALAHFHAKMLVRGWEKKQLCLVFIMRRSTPNYLRSIKTLKAKQHENHFPNVGVIDLESDNLWRWLGPTVSIMARHMEAFSRCDSPQNFYDSNLSDSELKKVKTDEKSLCTKLSKKWEGGQL